jgi:hypothetical protein
MLLSINAEDFVFEDETLYPEGGGSSFHRKSTNFYQIAWRHVSENTAAIATNFAHSYYVCVSSLVWSS